ncbi:hypothetical protein ATCC90586_010494 [Pythium insidiosum]|nr:hypothetical protein ATCC90586_010494 [Pythium insidiosum]
MWTKTATTGFHLSIVACGNAAGKVLPPVFILPGQRVRSDLLDACHDPAPLDVSCFSSLKKAIRKDVHEFMVETGAINISKRDAVQIGVSAWKKCNLDANLKAGFETTVLFPLNKVAMINRFRRFQGNELLQQEATKPATKKAKKSASKIATSPGISFLCL